MPRSQRFGSSSKVELPVTPMLDMTFQLLAFLLLTFQPGTAGEGKLDFALPADNPGRAPSVQPAVPVSAPEPVLEEEETNLTVLVRTVRNGIDDGNISALIVQTAEGDIACRNLEDLRQTLQRRRGEQGGGRLRIAAECRLKYACVVEVLDTCLQAGYSRVGFVSPPDLGLN